MPTLPSRRCNTTPCLLPVQYYTSKPHQASTMETPCCIILIPPDNVYFSVHCVCAVSCLGKLHTLASSKYRWQVQQDNDPPTNCDQHCRPTHPRHTCKRQQQASTDNNIKYRYLQPVWRSESGRMRLCKTQRLQQAAPLRGCKPSSTNRSTARACSP
jgi:hypothetical protein